MARARSNIVSATIAPPITGVTIFSPWYSTLSPFGWRALSGAGPFTATYQPALDAQVAGAVGAVAVVALSANNSTSDLGAPTVTLGGVAMGVARYRDLSLPLDLILCYLPLTGVTLASNVLSVTWPGSAAIYFDGFVAATSSSTKASIAATVLGAEEHVLGELDMVYPSLGSKSLIAGVNCQSATVTSNDPATIFSGSGKFNPDYSWKGEYQIPAATSVTTHFSGIGTDVNALTLVLAP